MVIKTPPPTWSLLLFAEQRPQSAADKTIDHLMDQWMSLLEVVKPPAQHRIKILDDLCQAVSARALGLQPDVLTQRSKALGPHPA